MTSETATPSPAVNSKKGFLHRIPVGLISTGIIGAFGLLFGTWTTIVDDPLGGQSIAVVSIESTKPAIVAENIAVIDIGTAEKENEPVVDGKDVSSMMEPMVDGDGSLQNAANTAAAGDVNNMGSELDTDGQASVPGKAGAPKLLNPELKPLSATPRKDLVQNSKYGPLPRISPAGLAPWKAYAAEPGLLPLNAPRIVLVVGGVGLSQSSSQLALDKLPSEVTLAFAPYADDLEIWTKKARIKRHELLLQLPMEPFDFPDNDPGPHTLMSKLGPAENIDRLRWLLGRMTNYVGVANYMGARFTADAAIFQPAADEIGRRGLMYFDDGSSTRSQVRQVASDAQMPVVSSHMIIDQRVDADAIDIRLLELEGQARAKGLAVGTATAFPVSIERIADWAKTLEERGVVLVPVTTVIRSANS